MLSLTAEHVERGKADILENKSRERSNLKHGGRLDSFDVGASFKIGDRGIMQLSGLIELPVAEKHLGLCLHCTNLLRQIVVLLLPSLRALSLKRFTCGNVMCAR